MTTKFALPVLADSAPSLDSVLTQEESDLAPGRPAGETGFGPSYWRSIDEKLQSSTLVDSDREFPEGATEPPAGFARREFIQLAAASVALAGLNACTEKPVERVLPYTKTPDGLAPGLPLHFATAHPFNGHANGLLVTSWEGRPTKIEGNPLHPVSLGATSLFEQALTLQLYDPQRARLIKKGGAGKAWRTLRETLVAKGTELEADGGAKLRFLLEPSSSPLEASLRAEIQKRFPKAKFYSASSVSRDNAYAGARLAFGQPVETHYELEQADIVLSLDDDFLEASPTQLRNNRAFAKRRDPKHPRGLSRLYVVESRLSLTGGMADNRLRVRSSDVEGVTLSLLGRVVPAFAGLVKAVVLSPAQEKFVAAVAKDLTSKPGHSLVAVGFRQSPLTHAAAHVLNDALGNAGKTVHHSTLATLDEKTSPSAWKELVDEMNAGQVDTLVITAWNPAFTAPGDWDFAAALKKVPTSLYTGLYEDETSQLTTWFVPAAHLLESWGDTRAKDGTVSVIQPLIRPLFNGVTAADLLSALTAAPERTVYEQLRTLHAANAKGPDFDGKWETWLAEGVIPDTAAPKQTFTVSHGSVQQAASSAKAPDAASFEVSFVHDYKVFDGRYANATWIQEIPDPITKLTWDNAALISPTTAKELSVEQGDLIKLSRAGKSLEIAVFIVPGHADRTVTLALGYGRKGEEEIAKGVGFNVNVLRTAESPWFTTGVTVTKVGKTYDLSATQVHWSMEGRKSALMQTAEDFKNHPDAPEQRRPLPTLFRPFDYTKEKYRWGMGVDLSRCTGCSACIIACQAENNIPVVGKYQVGRGREMHWMRVDRYFTGSDTDPEMVTEPMMCQHCEAAPCEYVCPVNATVHSDEGLNDMVYNRCIGTRYCSNNCPYKVRRFNFLHWNADMPAIVKMASNPDVTVRARGVMEKCTYCVQRIERTRIVARIENRAIRETELKSACQQVCPTEAIVFGNIGDPQTEVSHRHGDERRYDVLHELNTRPRTAYLTKIKNPNPELA